MLRISRLARRTRDDERGVETAAMIFVIPVLFILIIGLVSVGMSMRTRMSVENILRDAARHAASDGGDFNSRFNSGKAWSKRAQAQLWDTTKKRCKQSAGD